MVIQAFLAVAGLRMMLFRVFPNLSRIHHSALVIDIWGPITIVLPMMVMVGHLDGDVRSSGWVSVGGPLLCAYLTFGLIFLAGRNTDVMQARPTSRTLVIWMGLGLIYLLLSIAYTMTIWTGQVLFAMGAVLMWINTPDVAGHAQTLREEDTRVVSGVTLALLFGVGQGIAGYLVEPDYRSISGAMMIVYAVMILAGAVRIAGTNIALRLGGWAATYGMLFSLGTASLLFMIPTVIGYFMGNQPSISVGVARGFGLYAFEAMGLLLLGPAVLLVARLGAHSRRFLGGAVLLGAAVLAALRLAGV